MINNKMSLNDIHEVTADISNSLWTLRKNGELNHLTDEEFTELYKTACKLSTKSTWAFAYRNRIEREI